MDEKPGAEEGEKRMLPTRCCTITCIHTLAVVLICFTGGGGAYWLCVYHSYSGLGGLTYVPRGVEEI